MSTIHEPTHQLRPVGELRVVDAMHPGMVSCPPETSLRTVARMMASYRIHAIVVHWHGDEPAVAGEQWGVVTDGDLVKAAQGIDLDAVTAGEIAATPVLAVASAEPLEHAIQLMIEHEASHVIAVERRSGRPLGVLSTLDVARVLAGAAQ